MRYIIAGCMKHFFEKYFKPAYQKTEIIRMRQQNPKPRVLFLFINGIDIIHHTLV